MQQHLLGQVSHQEFYVYEINLNVVDNQNGTFTVNLWLVTGSPMSLSGFRSWTRTINVMDGWID